MKSLFLVGITGEGEARLALNRLLPGQEHPWLLLDRAGDPIAYFDIGPDNEDPSVLTIEADISGRHYDDAKTVRAMLVRVADAVGGTIEDDQ